MILFESKSVNKVPMLFFKICYPISKSLIAAVLLRKRDCKIYQLSQFYCSRDFIIPEVDYEEDRHRLGGRTSRRPHRFNDDR